MAIAVLITGIMISVTTESKTAQSGPLPLYYLVRQPRIKTGKPPLLILLHGVGSNENDLFSFANTLDDRFLVVSVRAPYTISEGSYKWYEVGFSGGAPKIDTAQAEKSRSMLVGFISQLGAELDFDPARVYLCGFSQGAIMSFSVGLTKPESVRGIIALSGRVLAEINPQIAEKNRFGQFKTLLIHGTQDQVLPIHYARESRQLLEGLGIETEYHELETGHTITRETLGLINAWLGRQ